MYFVPLMLNALAVNQVASSNAKEAIELPHKIYILPEAIPMWPPVWWSWLLLAGLIIAIILIGVFYIRAYKHNAYRREAIKLLIEAHQLPDAAFLMACHRIIRRCLITKQRHDLAALPNNELFRTLDKNMKANNRFEQLGNAFINGAYQPSLNLTDAEKDKILLISKNWCRRYNA